MAKRTGNLSKLRVGERGEKLNPRTGMVTLYERIATTGFPQYKILGNRPAR